MAAGFLAHVQSFRRHRVRPAAQELVQGSLTVRHGGGQLLQQGQHRFSLASLDQQPVQGQRAVAQYTGLGLQRLIHLLHFQTVFQAGKIVLDGLLQGAQPSLVLDVIHPQPPKQGGQKVGIGMYGALLDFAQVGRHAQAVTDRLLLSPLTEPLHAQNCPCQQVRISFHFNRLRGVFSNSISQSSTPVMGADPGCVE